MASRGDSALRDTSRRTFVLGVSAFFHDSAACLLENGRIVGAAQEERFTRRKADAGFPTNAVAYCLGRAGITAQDLDAVAFYERPLLKFDRLLETYASYAPQGFDSFRRALTEWGGRKLDMPSLLRDALGDGLRARFSFPEHHESHAASAFFPSPFEESAILVLDAVGEWASTSMGVGRGNTLELTQEVRFPHSIGMLYSAITQYAGFKVNSGEYKLMGLAPYGIPRFADLMRDTLVDLKDDGSVWLDMSYFDYAIGRTMTSTKLHTLLGGPPREPESRITQKEMDLAASVQALCEEAVLKAARHAQRETGQRRVCLAGGVALNCVANGRLLREGPFEDVWIQPAAGDAGGALGAAHLVWHGDLREPRVAQHPDGQQGSLLGPEYSDEDVGLFLDSVGARYHHLENEDTLLDRVAGLLVEECVVGWFHGRMEFGPRALGARSIIGDARSPRMQQVMNLKIKFRESFRPFAPCVLSEHAASLFDCDRESPYMLLVAPVREELRMVLSDEDRRRQSDPDLRIRVNVARSSIPAVTHVDYSARVQTVDAGRHGRFYRLLQRFHALTACPVLVNTSFNVRGEPIVCTPQDAYRCFMATGMDALVLENHILMKAEQRAEAIMAAADYVSRYELD